MNKFEDTVIPDIKFLKHSNQKFDQRILLITYEKLHRDFEKEVQRIFLFLGETAEDCVSFGQNALPAFGGRGTQPTSFFRSGETETWKQYFHKEEAQILWDTAKDVFIWGGYETDERWIDSLRSRN